MAPLSYVIDDPFLTIPLTEFTWLNTPIITENCNLIYELANVEVRIGGVLQSTPPCVEGINGNGNFTITFTSIKAPITF